MLFTSEFMHSFCVNNVENLRMAPGYLCCLGELWVFVSYRLWVQRFVCVRREMPFVFSFVFQGRGAEITDNSIRCHRYARYVKLVSSCQQCPSALMDVILIMSSMVIVASSLMFALEVLGCMNVDITALIIMHVCNGLADYMYVFVRKYTLAHVFLHACLKVRMCACFCVEAVCGLWWRMLA